MPARSLLKLAAEACIANLRYLFDVGDAPYHIVRPILLKLHNPQQLRDIEKASPQICGADAEIWRGFIKRDIPNWESKKHEPKNPHNWYKVYNKLKREADEESTKRTAALKAQLNQLSAEKESRHITFDPSLTVPGGRRRIHTPQHARPKPSDSSTLTFRAGSRTKTTTGKSILEKARREAREASHYGSIRGALATPTHLLAAVVPQKSISQPSVAPRQTAAAPVEEHKEPAGSVQASREEASRRRERALAQQRVAAAAAGSPPGVLNPPTKRAANNVFMPSKKRRP